MGELSEQGGDSEHIFRSRLPPVTVPDNLTLPEYVLQNAADYADKVAIVDAATGHSFTYADISRDVALFARALRGILGIRTGDVAVVILPNVIEYPTVALGIMAAGGVFSGANPSSHPSELQKQVSDCEARLIITTQSSFHKVKHLEVPIVILDVKTEDSSALVYSELLAAAAAAAEAEEDAEKTTAAIDPSTELCAMPYSSGTTGASKGVMLTHRSLIANLCSSLHSVGKEMVGEVTTLGMMPFFHIYGINGICCSTLRCKGTVVAMQRFELRSFLDTLKLYRVQFAPIVPPIMLALVNSPVVEEYDVGALALQAVMTAAAPLAPELLAAFERRFPGVQIQEAYGMTEHSCITLTHGDPRKGHRTSKRSSVGSILPNMEVKFVDPGSGRSLPANCPGEICVRSPGVMKGYYKKEEETAMTVDGDGWLHTGDVGYIDDDGDIFIVDRIKELIKYKGFQVAPAELEAVLLSNPAVVDAAVFGLADEMAGEIPVACVVKKSDAQETEGDLIKYVEERVAAYKKLRALHFVDAIPKSAAGKIMRRVLRDAFAAKASS